MKNIIQLASYAVLLGCSLLLGLLGKPTEMGLSILAGAIGLSFANIDKIRRFKGAGFEAEMREQIEAVLEKEIEPAAADRTGLIKVESYVTDEKTRKIVKALKNPKYTWRHTNGITKETGLSREEIENSLNWLIENGLGKQSFGPIGTIWSLTFKGRNVFQSVNEE